MKLYLKLSAILMALALLSSCRSSATFDEVNALRKGMSSTTVQEKLILSPSYSFDISRNGRKYTGECYWVMTFQATTSTGPTMMGGSMVSSGSTSTTTSKDILLLLYDNNQLMYWGFLNEFSKSDDPLITPLADAIYDEYTRRYPFDGIKTTTITR